MKIECTTKEAVDLVIELRDRQQCCHMDVNLKLYDEDIEKIQSASDKQMYICDSTKNISCPYFKKKCPEICNRLTLHREYAKLDACGNPFQSHSLMSLEADNL